VTDGFKKVLVGSGLLTLLLTVGGFQPFFVLNLSISQENEMAEFEATSHGRPKGTLARTLLCPTSIHLFKFSKIF